MQLECSAFKNTLTMTDAAKTEDATITVRVIRSLAYKNWKPLVIRNLNLCGCTLSELRVLIEEKLLGGGFPAPFTRDLGYYDSIKLETDPDANYSKSCNALINTTTRSIPFTPTSEGMDRTLSSIHVTNESDLSLFNSKDYAEYLKTV